MGEAESGTSFSKRGNFWHATSGIRRSGPATEYHKHNSILAFLFLKEISFEKAAETFYRLKKSCTSRHVTTSYLLTEKMVLQMGSLRLGLAHK